MENNKYRRWLLVAMLLASVAGISCQPRPEKPGAVLPEAVRASAPGVASDVAAQESPQVRYEARPHDPDRKLLLVQKIEFVIKDPELANEGPRPYVNLENPAKAIRFMEKADDIVVSSTSLYVVVDYPTEGAWEFRLVSASPKGFTRAGLAKEISQVYRAMYAEEERSAKAAVVPPEPRGTLINRDKTAGTYGIWGHDIGDLDLHTIEIHRAADGTLYAVLGIDS